MVKGDLVPSPSPPWNTSLNPVLLQRILRKHAVK